ncbi:MAG TPA: BTAD domain-containing putative transcriptional regulator [Candidatus Limnocylindrales bacterium]|nr:BTAD domain-containing putative transcriptional regulator [Candidatus Limnocylindrales bacterium]
MEFLILGPLEVRVDGQALALGGAGQRGLLALLLLHANRVVSIDRLIGDLWGADPPETGAAAVQMRVSGLRRTLEGKGARAGPSNVLITRAPGYLLRVEPGHLDADLFETGIRTGRAALAAGDPDAAADALADALRRWRGDPLADVAYEPFAQAEIARLTELRLSGTEDRIEADLALGRHGGVIGELEGLVSVHPFRERLTEQLMLSLYRSGRQADALAAYRSTSRRLRDDLGIEPGIALQRLEAAILRQEPELDAPASTPPAPTDRQPNIGATPERRKPVTVVVGEFVVDAGASTADPEGLRSLTDRRLGIAAEVVGRHGATFERVLGSEFVAVFGLPAIHEDDPVRAARATLELQARLDRPDHDREEGTGPRIDLRIGVESGEIVTGDGTPASPLVSGEALLDAARLAHAAPDGQILIGAATRSLLAGRARSTPSGNVDSLEAWRLLELGADLAAAPGTADGPLVGRAAELRLADEAFDRVVRDRAVGLCTVLGPAGIGKSRLVRAFTAGLAGRARVLTGRCVPYGTGVTFWPFAEIVRQVAESGSIVGLLGDEPQAALVAERVAGALGLAESDQSVEDTFWAFRILLEGLAAHGPLVVVLEDVHWAEPTLLNLVEYLSGWMPESPLLIVCLARPELLEARPTWGGGRANATLIHLGPLDESESETLVGGLPGEARLQPTVRRRIHETAEGNPLFLEQLVSMVAERGEPEPGLGGQLRIPPTIQAVLAARLERVGPAERAILDAGAVIGREWASVAVGALLPEETRRLLTRHLEALVRRDFVRPIRSPRAGDQAFQFRHALIQQSAYQSIPRPRRRRLHEAFAEWLEAGPGGRTAELDELVGYHLEQACAGRSDSDPDADHDRQLARHGADRLAIAGRRVFRRGDMPASANLLERAARLLPLDDPLRLDLLSDLGFALFEIGELDRSADALTEAIARAGAIGDRRVVARASVQAAHVAMYRHPDDVDGPHLLREAAAASTVLRRAGDSAGLARAALLESEVRWTLGSGALAARAAIRAVRHARRAESRREEAWSHGDYGYYAVFGPAPVPVALLQLRRWMHEAGGDPVLDANLSGFVAPLEAMEGRIPEARDRLAQSRIVTADLGLRWQTGTHDLLAGFIEMLAGDPAAAATHLQTAVDFFSEVGDMWFLSIVSVEQARALCERQLDAEAAALVAHLDTLPADPSASYRVRRGEVLARLAARRGDHAAARSLAEASVALAAETDFLGFHGDALVGLAEVHRRAGRPHDANAALVGAFDLFVRKGNVVAAERTRRAMTEPYRGEARTVS